MTSRRDSRAYSTGLNTLQEFETLRRNFKASNDRLAKKNNELQVQLTTLNKQLHETSGENFKLRNDINALRAQTSRFATERREMLDMVEETTRASKHALRQLSALRHSLYDTENAHQLGSLPLAPNLDTPRRRPSLPSALAISRVPEVSPIQEESSDEDVQGNVLEANGPQEDIRFPPTLIRGSIASSSRFNPDDLLATTPAGSLSVTIRNPSRRSSASNTSKVQIRPQSSSPVPEPQEDPNAIGMDGQVLDATTISLNKGKGKTPEYGVQDSGHLEGTPKGLNDVTNSPPPSRGTSHKVKKSPPFTQGDGDAEDLLGIAPALLDSSVKSEIYVDRRIQRPNSPIPEAPLFGRGNVDTGREKRVRKSVNYAEPKLNTKMRKPEPTPNAAASSSSSPPDAPTTVSSVSMETRRRKSGADGMMVARRPKKSSLLEENDSQKTSRRSTIFALDEVEQPSPLTLEDSDPGGLWNSRTHGSSIFRNKATTKDKQSPPDIGQTDSGGAANGIQLRVDNTTKKRKLPPHNGGQNEVDEDGEALVDESEDDYLPQSVSRRRRSNASNGHIAGSSRRQSTVSS